MTTQSDAGGTGLQAVSHDTTSLACRAVYRVVTGSRLHFGLICPGNTSDEKVRRFGSVGLMIDSPGVALRVEEAADWSADGPLAARAIERGGRVANSLGEESTQSPRRLIIEQAAPEHAGLGTGTQLALAVASALTRSWGRQLTSAQLAGLTGRGRRSALGVHGFEQGGFLIDGGKGPNTSLAPLIARHEFPSSWRVLIIVPACESGLAGFREQAAFAQLRGETGRMAERMCRLVLMEMTPALLESDLPVFGEVLFEFNALAGELFAAVQGGRYASREVEAVVGWLRQAGVKGTGQSSWGPGVFGVVEDEDRGRWLLDRAAEQFPQALAWLTAARNVGAMTEGCAREQEREACVSRLPEDPGV